MSYCNAVKTRRSWAHCTVIEVGRGDRCHLTNADPQPYTPRRLTFIVATRGDYPMAFPRLTASPSRNLRRRALRDVPRARSGASEICRDRGGARDVARAVPHQATRHDACGAQGLTSRKAWGMGFEPARRHYNCVPALPAARLRLARG